MQIPTERTLLGKFILLLQVQYIKKMEGQTSHVTIMECGCLLKIVSIYARHQVVAAVTLSHARNVCGVLL